MPDTFQDSNVYRVLVIQRDQKQAELDRAIVNLRQGEAAVERLTQELEEAVTRWADAEAAVALIPDELHYALTLAQYEERQAMTAHASLRDKLTKQENWVTRYAQEADDLAERVHQYEQALALLDVAAEG